MLGGVPRILFVGVANMSASRIAEGLLRLADPRARVGSAGVSVAPGARGIDEDARRALAEIGARCDGDPRQLTASLADRHDEVIVLGDVDVGRHIAPDCAIRRWVLDDPAGRGVTGLARHRRLRAMLGERIRAELVRGATRPD